MNDKKPVPPALAEFALEQLAEAGEQTIRASVTIDTDAAARVLAEGLDYPWIFMPENGRQSMRELARRVVEAAQLNPCRAQAVPDGYVMVPVEPTPEMREVIMSGISHDHVVRIYKDMVAAAGNNHG